MSVPSTREPQEIPASQIIRGLNAVDSRAHGKRLPFKAGACGMKAKGRAQRCCAPAKREDGEVPDQDRYAKNAKLAATRGCAHLGDYSEPPPKRRMTMPVETQ
jgi:hypothetical protein